MVGKNGFSYISNLFGYHRMDGLNRVKNVLVWNMFSINFQRTCLIEICAGEVPSYDCALEESMWCFFEPLVLHEENTIAMK